MADETSSTAELVYNELLDTVSSGVPALTAPEIAKRLDISEPTARRHLSDIAEKADVRSTEIGRAQAYWVGNNQSQSAISPPNVLEISPYQRLADEKRVAWKRTEQEAYRYISDKGSTPRLAAELGYRLLQYLKTALSGIPEEEESYYLSSNQFFSIEWYGDVVGLRGLEKFLKEALYELSPAEQTEIMLGQAELDPDFANSEKLRAIYPDATELIAAGQTADNYLLETTSVGVN